MKLSSYCGAMLLVALLLFSCRTTVPSGAPVVDYTDSRSVVREMNAVRALIAEKPLDAVLRAHHVMHYSRSKTDEMQVLYQDACLAAKKCLFEAVEKKAWKQALVLWRSLSVLGQTVEAWTEQKLVAAMRESWKERKFAALLQAADDASDKVSTAPSLEIVRKMMKAVVTVWVDRGMTIKKGLGMADRMIGSGFFIDSNGYIITNYHVIQSEVDPAYEGYSRVYVKHAERPTVRIPARVIGWDPVFDIALLKTELTSEVHFKLGSSKDLDVGSKIYAIGSPAGLEQTLTSGIVSAQKRRLLSLGSVLQIDAPINHGNSGGPIIDEEGRVQAIVFAGLERNEGLNFAIPVELLRVILPDLYEGGEVSHAWMSSYGVSKKGETAEEHGTELVYTVPGSTSSTIPLGTVITHINGRRVSDLEALQAELMHVHADTIVKISGYTNQKLSEYFVKLEQRPRQPAELIYRKDSRMRTMLPLYGMRLESAGGAKSFRIASVIPGSYADETGFSAGDYLEIRTMKVQKEAEAVYTQVYTKRRKAAYIDTFIDMWVHLDDPSYF